MTQSRSFIAATFVLLAFAPAMADDAERMRRLTGGYDAPPGAARLDSLQGVDSAGALFLKGAADPPRTEAQRSRVTSLTVTFSAQVDNPAMAPPVTPTPPVAALALPLDGARPGGTNLYGFTRDPRAVTTTPAGLRFADPKVLQMVKPDFAGSKFVLAR